MADTRSIPELTPTQWDDQEHMEYFQRNPFAPYMRNSENAVIRVNEELTAKKGQAVRFAFTTQLNGPTVLDDAPLMANAESFGTYYDDVTTRPRAKAVVNSEWSNQLSAIDIRRAAKSALNDWSDRETRDEVIKALGAVDTASDVPFATATAGQKNNWCGVNSDRVLFGKDTSNYSATFATAAANIDATNDRATRRTLSLMRRLATMANPAVAPLRDEKNGKRRYVAFAHPYLFRDLSQDLEQSNREVSIIDKNTILFQGGDLEWDGIIIHEVDDMPIYTGIGAGGSVNVAPLYLCGQNALGFGWAKRWFTETEEADFKRFRGVSKEGWWGIKKLVRRAATPADATVVNKQVGVVTGFFAAVAD